MKKKAIFTTTQCIQLCSYYWPLFQNAVSPNFDTKYYKQEKCTRIITALFTLFFRHTRFLHAIKPSNKLINREKLLERIKKDINAEKN
jgi:hypothetical protein